MAGKQTYDAENIAVLEGLEAVKIGRASCRERV